MNLLQINTVGNIGSTGRIAEQIGIEAMRKDWKSYIACARSNQSKSDIIRIGTKWHRYPNVLWTRIFDSDSPLSRISTLKFINDIKKLSPDIIHLHNLHGYYLHVPTLLEFLGEYNRPVVWTLHDCWPFTGHCSHFDFCGCYKWKTLCYKCPQKMEYPASWIFDHSKKNHQIKIRLISNIKNIAFVAVSNWLGDMLRLSRLPSTNIHVIRNGINLDTFSTDASALNNYSNIDKSKKIALFASSKWTIKKGFHLIPEISKMLGNSFQCCVIGTTKRQSCYLNNIGIATMDNIRNPSNMASIYKMSDIFVNPSLEEALSLVNMEAIACGTPVVTFASGGTPETIPNEKVGAVVKRGDIDAMVCQIKKFAALDKLETAKICRQAALDNFDAKAAFKKYIDLYESLT